MKKLSLLTTSVAAMFFSSCSDSQFDGFSKSENGLHYQFFTQNESGTKVQEGDGVTLRYLIMKQGNDSVIVDSKEVSRDGSGYTQLAPVMSSFSGSLEDGLKMMCEGDSAAFIISADSFFLKTQRANELPKGFKPGEHIKAIFALKKITPKAEIEAKRKEQMEQQEAMMKEREAMAKEMAPKEKPALEKYVADNKIKVKPTASGLYYLETKKGSGNSPIATDLVTVHYTGKLLDGTVFDSSVERGEPVELPVNRWIPGWTEGLQMMKKGGKATFIVPSALAYGEQGAGDRIPPYSALVFDLELIDIKPAPVNGGASITPGH